MCATMTITYDGHGNAMITLVSGMCYLHAITTLLFNTLSASSSYRIMFRTVVGSDDVNIARGCRVITFTRFDSEHLHPEADAMIICRDESC